MMRATYPALNELKIRARLLLKALHDGAPPALERSARLSKKQHWEIPAQWTLRHCLNIVACKAGFQHWQHARLVLSAGAPALGDMGEFWYDRQAHGFTNHWFAHYPEAKAQITLHPDSYLLPYKKQFFVAEQPCITQLGLANDAALWQQLGNDLVAGYGSVAWVALCQLRLNTTRLQAQVASSITT